MDKEQKKKLVQLVEEAQPWERIPTSIEGIFLVKTPEHNNHQSVFVELNPSIKGQPIKKRGIYLKHTNELEAFIELLNNPKVKDLLEVVTEYYSTKQVVRIEL